MSATLANFNLVNAGTLCSCHVSRQCRTWRFRKVAQNRPHCRQAYAQGGGSVPKIAMLFGAMGWRGILRRCHQTLEEAILVNKLAVFVTLGSFQSNGLFADGTNRKRWKGACHGPSLLYEVENWTTIIFPDTGRQFQVLKVALICAVAVRLPRWEFLANKKRPLDTSHVSGYGRWRYKSAPERRSDRRQLELPVGKNA